MREIKRNTISISRPTKKRETLRQRESERERGREGERERECERETFRPR